jgi:hypothetical protein
MRDLAKGDSFVFQPGFYTSIKHCKSDATQLQLFKAIADYGVFGIIPGDDAPEVVCVAMENIMPVIEAAKRRRDNGNNGGRPSKTEDNRNKPNETEENPNVYVNDNVAENDTVSAKGKVSVSDKGECFCRGGGRGKGGGEGVGTPKLDKSLLFLAETEKKEPLPEDQRRQWLSGYAKEYRLSLEDVAARYAEIVKKVMP